MRSLSIFALLVSAASLASASTITFACTPTNVSSINATVITNPTTVTCAAQNSTTFLANSTFTNLSLSFVGSFSDANPNNGSKAVTFAGSSTYGNFSFATNTAQFSGTTGFQTPLNASTPLSAIVNSFQVAVNTSVTGSNPDSAQFTVFANYTYEVQQQSTGTPEPSTLALVGGVLVLAGLRKFRS